MIRKRFSVGLFSVAMGLAAASLSTSALAQEGYQIGEGAGTNQQQAAPAQAPAIAPDQGRSAPDSTSTAPTAPAESGPVRMARFSFMSGNVTWRPDPTTEWSPATDNLPLREGAQIWVGDGGRAELQFDDGSIIRFGSGAVATLQTMFSDSQGEFTEVKLTDGLASMDLRTDHSIFQMDTPKGSIKSTGPSRVRIGVDESVEVGIRQGTATFDGPQGKQDMNSGDYMSVSDNTPYAIQQLPGEDNWDKFTDERHDLMAQRDPNLPENMQYIAPDLDRFGAWKSDPEYGQVWAPDEPSAWQPYNEGKWVWCDPFGWTWVGAEPWGWAPYHYGSWIHRGWGWGWVPGPAAQYWSPGVVNFTNSGDDVCWAPLAPWECHYPSPFGLGIWGPGYVSYFSIGFCGVWFPFGDRFCGERPWNNGWVNHWHGGYGNEVASRGFGPGRGGPGLAPANVHFHPANSAFATSAATRENFGSASSYRTLSSHAGQEAFEKGTSVSSPARGGSLVAGPSNVRPGTTSWSSTRTLTTRPESTGILNRPVYSGVPERPTFTNKTSTGAPGLGTRPATTGPLSGADAARAARESLGWNRGNSGQLSPPRSTSSGTGTSFGGRDFGGTSRGGFSNGRPAPQGTSGRGWGIPDRGGWSHVHSDSRGSSSGSNRPSSSGGSSGGGSHGGGSGGGSGGSGGGGSHNHR